jgi:hypothetical protein
LLPIGDNNEDTLRRTAAASLIAQFVEWSR